MCRLFGFRSVIQSAVHRSLVEADNALAVQSQAHRDGWGVAYYVAEVPHVIKGLSPAVEDAIFSRVGGVVASETVLAHLRQATAGEVNVLNTHPFQYGRWIFAHNGKVRNFDTHRAALRSRVAPNLLRYVLGDTDSELLFYLFLGELARRVDLHRRGTPIADIAAALAAVIELTRAIADADLPNPALSTGGEACAPVADGGPSLLTFLVTDGASIIGVREGKPLLFSTHKRRCPDRDGCAWLGPSCEAPSPDGHVNHLIVSSEELQGNNVWLELQDHEYVGVDFRMVLHRGTLGSEPRRVESAAAASTLATLTPA